MSIKRDVLLSVVIGVIVLLTVIMVLMTIPA
jgi:hypothetical protein